jgi:rod shape-determining protein MreC
VFSAPVLVCSSVISSILARLAYVGSIFISVFQEPVERSQVQNLEREMENLKILLDEEKDRNRRLEELFEVYDSLTGGSNPESSSAFSLIPAKVIAMEPTNWFRFLTIDKGRDHGVDVDMAVITRPDSAVDVPYLTGAVVGKITDAQNGSAKVQLITDRLSVAAVTIEPLKDLVLLRGKTETENCVIDEIPSTTHDMLKEGNAVIVDERSSIFPPGMLVGHISSIRKGIHFCRIEVQPAFRFRKLREVMVVLDN